MLLIKTCVYSQPAYLSTNISVYNWIKWYWSNMEVYKVPFKINLNMHILSLKSGSDSDRGTHLSFNLVAEVELKLVWAVFVYPLYLKAKPVSLLVLNNFKHLFPFGWDRYVYLQIISTHMWAVARTSVGPRHGLKNSLLCNGICICIGGHMRFPSSLRVQGKCIHWQMWLCNTWSIKQEINEGQQNNRSKASYIAVCSWRRMCQGTVTAPGFQAVSREDWEKRTCAYLCIHFTIFIEHLLSSKLFTKCWGYRGELAPSSPLYVIAIKIFRCFDWNRY